MLRAALKGTASKTPLMVSLRAALGWLINAFDLGLQYAWRCALKLTA